MIKKFISILVALLVSVVAMPAMATVVFVNPATVGYLQVDYMPGQVVFTLNQAAGTCAVGTVLHYTSTNIDLVKAGYLAVMSSKTTGMPLRLYVEQTGCVVTSLLYGN